MRTKIVAVLTGLLLVVLSGAFTFPAHSAPVGPPGTWGLVFSDEFNASTLDLNKWNNGGKRQNGVRNIPSNVWVNRGKAVLNLSSTTTGAMLYSGPVDGIGSNHFQLSEGEYVEARVRFPGPGPGPGKHLYNWTAWWTVGSDNWPSLGEIDIAEASPWEDTGNPVSANYHGPNRHIGSVIPGSWSNAYHVYGAHRKASSIDYYFDGRLVKTLPANDPGTPHSLVFNHGLFSGQTAVLAPKSRVRVDWVRAWKPR